MSLGVCCAAVAALHAEKERDQGREAAVEDDVRSPEMLKRLVIALDA
jgi:hypothetical protein